MIYAVRESTWHRFVHDLRCACHESSCQCRVFNEFAYQDCVRDMVTYHSLIIMYLQLAHIARRLIAHTAFS